MGIIVFIIAIVVILVIWGISIYNGLIRKRNNSKNAWAQIETQLQRRYDLIPNLVNTVKGYAKHESETLNNVIKARNAAQTAQDSGSVKDAQEAVKSIGFAMNAVAEAYPDLKANANFLALQEGLSNTENTVSYARQAYNDETTVYNNSIQTFPGSLFANMLGFKEADLFEIESEAAAKAPAVSF